MNGTQLTNSQASTLTNTRVVGNMMFVNEDDLPIHGDRWRTSVLGGAQNDNPATVSTSLAPKK